MKKKVSYMLIFTIIMCCIASPISSLAAVTVYQAATAGEMEDIIFNAIQNRENAFKITYTGDMSDMATTIRTARDNAVKRDPYEEGCINLISGFNVRKYQDRADVYFNSFQYYTTKTQEQYVTREIQRIAAKLIKPSMNDNQKEKAIHDYIVSNIAYDSTLAGYTAYSALHDGKTVCNGFVQLAYRLFKEVGIEVRIIKGKITSGGTPQNHAWNMVKINKKWYHLDCTLNVTQPKVKGKISYKYYNLSDNEITADHQYETEKR